MFSLSACRNRLEQRLLEQRLRSWTARSGGSKTDRSAPEGSELGLRNLVQNRLQHGHHAAVFLEELLGLLVIDRDLKGAIASMSVGLIGLVSNRTERDGFFYLSAQLHPTGSLPSPARKTGTATIVWASLRNGEARRDSSATVQQRAAHAEPGAAFDGRLGPQGAKASHGESPA